DVNGNLKMRNGGIMFDDGSTLTSAEMGGSASSVSNQGTTLITSDSDEDGSGNIDLITGSTTRLTVNSNGNVGIGTAGTPAYKLDVNGDMNFSGSLYQNGSLFKASPWSESSTYLYTNKKIAIGTVGTGYTFQILNDDAQIFLNNGGYSALRLVANKYNSYGYVAGSSNNSKIRFHNNDDISIRTYSSGYWSNPLYIKANGDVGINTVSPSYTLDVGGNINFTGTLYQNGSQFQTSKWNSNGDFIYYSDNVGIGVSSGDGNLNLPYNYPAILWRSGTRYKGGFRWDYNGGETMVMGVGYDGTKMMFAVGFDITANTGSSNHLPTDPELTITNNYVGVNKKSPATTLHLKQRGADSGLRIEAQGSETDYWDICFGSTDDNLNFRYNDYTVSWINTSDGTWHDRSDIRLKENITDLEPVLDKVMKINTYRYNFKDKNKNQIGFIAQDLEKYYPEFISENNGYKGVGYANLTPVLVKAIQEQQEIIEAQKNELAELKAKMAKFQSAMDELEVMISTLNQPNSAQRGD
ncbi:hypothetical protein GF337_14790, partial [candidate division KSB1 bacterium]|nr:hypothetical protein [candidate division KSB1 bacterium]